MQSRVVQWVRAFTLAGLVALVPVLPARRADAVSPEKRLTQLSIRRFGLDQGLPTISIGALAQDGEGTLWIGTGEGLVSFDGFDFTVFDRRNTPAFASNEVAALEFDSDGTLWIGMADGWLCRKGGGAVERVDRLAGRVVLRRRGRHVLAAADGQPFRRTGDRLTAEPSIRGEMPGATLTGIVADAAGDTWVSSLDGDFLARFRGGLRVPVEPKVPGFPAGPVDWLGADGKGGIWVVGRPGIHHVGAGRVRSYRPPPEMGGETFHGLLVDSAGCLLFGSSTRGGLARLCGERFDVVGRGSGLGGDWVISLLEDPDGSLWAGTWDAGLAQLSDGPFSVLGDADGLVTGSSTTFLESRDGSLLIGTAGGLCRLGAKGIRCLGPAEGLSSPQVRSLAETPDGRLYVGTNAGLFLLTGDRFVPSTPARVAPGPVWMLFRDRSGAIWASVDEQLFRLDGALAHRVEVDKAPHALVEDATGQIWAATRTGIQKLDRASSRLVHVETPLPETRPIFMSALADRKGRLWFGSYQGGVLVGPPGGPFRLVTTRDGLPDDNALGMVEDLEGRIWLTGGRGLVSVEAAAVDDFLSGRSSRLTCRKWGRRHGLKSAELHGGSGLPAFRARDGRLWFATSAGAVSVDPSRLRADAPPAARLSRLLLDGDPRSPRDPLQVPPGTHRMEVGWAARHRLEPESVLFRRRLVGWDDKWIAGGAVRRAEYTGLDPGRYRLEVQASFDGMDWGAPAVAEIGVGAFWYQTVPGRAGLVLAAVLAGLAVVRVRLSRARARAERLEALVSERSNQLVAAEGEIRRRREMEPLLEFGQRVSGILDAEAVLGEAARTLVLRAGEVPRLLVAAREGSPTLVEGSDPRPAPEEAGELIALLRGEAGPSPLVLGNDDSPRETDGLSSFVKAGLRVVAPLRSGESVFGFVACGEPPGASDGLPAFVAALATQASSALQGAWQAAEAARWRRVSDARVEWMTLDPVARVVYAVAARSGGVLTAETLVSSVLEAFGKHRPDQAGVRSALDRLVEAGILERGADGAHAIVRGDWLLLPELGKPLAELARESLYRVGAYRLVERIGAGGMGEVYRAVNAHDGSPAAVKLLGEADSTNTEARRRLEREGKIIAAIRHPGVVRFLERGEHLGRLYFAMELLDGEALSERLARGRLPEAEATRLARQLLSALACLHEAGVVHRDVTAGNVFRCRDGRFVLLDLGLARGLDQSTLTRTRQLVGTLPYMSPEQLRGEEVDARADLWSAGVVLYQALSGSLPWTAGNAVRMAIEILRADEAPAPDAVPAGSPLGRVLSACLQGDREKRASSASRLLELLEEVPVS